MRQWGTTEEKLQGIQHGLDLSVLLCTLQTYRDHPRGDLDTVNDLDSCGNNCIVFHVTHGNEVMDLGDAKKMKWI